MRTSSFSKSSFRVRLLKAREQQLSAIGMEKVESIYQQAAETLHQAARRPADSAWAS